MAPGVVPAAMAPGVLPATNPANAPATAPAIATPPVQLPPLGRNLELPPGVIPGQTTASGAYISNGNPAIPPRMQMALPGARDRSLVPMNQQAPRAPQTSNPPQNNSIEIYLSPTPDPTAGPQAAPDPVNPVSQSPISQIPASHSGKQVNLTRRPAIDPNAPLELVVLNDNSTAASGTSH